MDSLPLNLVTYIYKLNHEMRYHAVMVQLRTYRLHTRYLVSVDFLKYGYYSFGEYRVASIDINNIDALSGDIVNLIKSDSCKK